MTTQGSEKENHYNHPFYCNAGGHRFTLAHNGVLYKAPKPLTGSIIAGYPGRQFDLLNARSVDFIKLDPDTKEAEILLDVVDADYAHGATAYTDLAVRQVFWDIIGSRLPVDGEFLSIKKDVTDDGWESTGDGAGTYRGIFTLEAGELKFFAKVPGNPAWLEYNSIRCALDNGTFVIGYRCYNEDKETYTRIYNFRKGIEIAKIDHASFILSLSLAETYMT